MASRYVLFLHVSWLYPYPTCGGAPGPGKIGRCSACVEEEWSKLRAEMGEE